LIRTTHFFASFLCCAGVVACAPAPQSAPPLPSQTEIWPTHGWATSTPEEQGIDSVALAKVIDWIRDKQIPVHSLFLERNGHAVLDAYFFPFDASERHDVASVTKSVASSLIGIAQGEGKLGDLNAPISELLPAETRTLDDPRKGAITLSNLLDMTSGLDCNAAPGENLLLEMEQSADWPAFMLNRPLVSLSGSKFQYCGAAFHMVSVILTGATGFSAFDLARNQIFGPLGIANAVWPSDPQGNSHGFADLELQPRDAAKLGYLWLHHGRWGQQQIIPESYLTVALGTHAQVQPGITYGYGFWLYPSHRPYDFEANGRGGQRITVVPAQNLVSVVTAGGADANTIAPLLAAAVKSDVPLPPNSQGALELAKAIAGAAHPHAPVMPTAVPQWARNISGKMFAVSDNPLGLVSLQLIFASDAEVLLRTQFAGGVWESHPVGMDGVPRLSTNGKSGHRIALLGTWRPGGLLLDYNTIARIDDYRFHLAPVADGLEIHLTERTGLIDMQLLAKAS
jgi:CubicO group peptidase (beta-lactamase class C family)